jgi:hypothetical protein
MEMGHELLPSTDIATAIKSNRRVRLTVAITGDFVLGSRHRCDPMTLEHAVRRVRPRAEWHAGPGYVWPASASGLFHGMR